MVAMKKKMILAGVFTCLLGNSHAGWAMGDKPPVDPACFASDILRVEIGGKRFAFPRKMVRELAGPDVVHPTSQTNSSVEGTNACQKPNDPIWVLDWISLDLLPNGCNYKKNCNEDAIYIHAEDWRYRQKIGDKQDNIHSDTPKDLQRKCQQPIEPYSEWHKKVWSICDYVFREKELWIWIKFRGGIYPPKDIEKTKKMVLENLKKNMVN